MRRVLISGASSGIGLACARHLSQEGWQVLAGYRRQGDKVALEELAKCLPIYLDVASPDSIASVQSLLKNSPLDALILNAGIAVTGPWESVPLEEVTKCFSVNVFGAIALTQICIPQLREARGRIIGISSVSGRVALPLFGPYSASKFAFESFCDGLRRELAPEIKVTIVEPGPIRTPIWSKGLRTFDADPMLSERYRRNAESNVRFARHAQMNAPTPDVVAKAISAILESGRPPIRKVIGLNSWFGMQAVRLLPDRLLDRFLRV